MVVTVNGKKHQFDEPINIAAVLDRLKIPLETGVAVAHNSSVVAANRMANTDLTDGDSLEIIHATAGG